MAQPLWKSVWWLLKKLNIELPPNPAIPLLGINPRELKTYAKTCTKIFIASLFVICQKVETT